MSSLLPLLNGTDYLVKDDECLEISRVRVSDVARFGVYRGRARDEDMLSFSDRPRIPELGLVGVRGGISQRPRGRGIVLGPKGLRREVRCRYIIRMRTQGSELVSFDSCLQDR